MPWLTPSHYSPGLRKSWRPLALATASRTRSAPWRATGASPITRSTPATTPVIQAARTIGTPRKRACGRAAVSSCPSQGDWTLWTAAVCICCRRPTSEPTFAALPQPGLRARCSRPITTESWRPHEHRSRRHPRQRRRDMSQYTPDLVLSIARALQSDDAEHYTADAAHMLEDYAATLRQQAARVDEEMVERAVAAYRRTTHAMPQTQHDRMRAAIEAAISAKPAERQGEQTAAPVGVPEGAVIVGSVIDEDSYGLIAHFPNALPFKGTLY